MTSSPLDDARAVARRAARLTPAEGAALAAAWGRDQRHSDALVIASRVPGAMAAGAAAREAAMAALASSGLDEQARRTAAAAAGEAAMARAARAELSLGFLFLALHGPWARSVPDTAPARRKSGPAGGESG
jgi:hypothetical protein